MAKRPSPRSDAQIRDRYRRGLRRSARAEEIDEELERTGVGESLAISRWNRGEDPTLNTMSRANAAVAARGFSAASADRGRAMQAVNEALQAEPSSDLPPVAREMYGRRRDRLIGNAEEFLRDADEYSGRRAGNYNIGVRKPSAAPAEPEPEATGRISVSGPQGTTEFDADVAAREYQQRQFKRAELLDNLRREGKHFADDRLRDQLLEKGISVEAVYIDGRASKFDTDKARGLLAQATFQAWDDDKRLTREAQLTERESRKTLSNLRSYQEYMGSRMGPDEATKLTDRIVELENDVALGQKDRGGLNSPGYWRRKVESDYNNAARDAQAATNVEDAATARTKTIKELTSKFDVSIDKILSMLEDGVLSPEELESLTPRT